MQRSTIPPWRTTAEAEAILAPLLALPAVVQLREAAAGRELHLVGGTLRDRLLGRQHRDIDAVVAGAGAAIADRLATALRARVVPLGHEALVSYRVAGRSLVVDLWDRGDVPLARDLARRDVTINALALNVASGRLLDPLGGLADLAERRLRIPAPRVLDDDPARVLRIVRLAAELDGFRPTAETLDAARSRSGRLTGIPGERVRHELEIILGTVPALASFELLCDLDIYPDLLLGEAPVAARAQGRRAFARADALVAGEGEHGVVGDPLLLHWALLLSPLPRELAAAAVARLRRLRYMGRRIARDLASVRGRARLPADPRAQRWFLHGLGPLWPTAALVAASLSTDLTLDQCRSLLRRLAELAAAEGERLFDPAPLLSADEVMRLTGLEPGPELGRTLEGLRRGQVEGDLATREDARRWLAGPTPR